jgi:hypothetical protein
VCAAHRKGAEKIALAGHGPAREDKAEKSADALMADATGANGAA